MNKILNSYHWENTRKNLCTKVAAQALGYSWQVLATSMAHETPPRYPRTFEYTPCPKMKCKELF